MPPAAEVLGRVYLLLREIAARERSPVVMERGGGNGTSADEPLADDDDAPALEAADAPPAAA